MDPAVILSTGVRLPDEPNTANVVPDAVPVTRPEPEIAAEDLHIARPDLGVGAFTLVREGDPVPAGLAALPRRSVAGSAPRKVKRGR